MSLRLLRTNPRYRNNPTGFSVRRSGLDWIIADASDKAVPGKRFSSEAAARSELAKLDGGAVSIAAYPAAPPRPAYRAPEPRPTLLPSTHSTSASATSGGKWAVVDMRGKYISPLMTREEAVKKVKTMLDSIGPTWDVHDRGLEILEETNWGNVAERHAYDIAQERAEAEWEAEAESMRSKYQIEVVPAAELVNIKLKMVEPRGGYYSWELPFRRPEATANVAYALHAALKEHGERWLVNLRDPVVARPGSPGNGEEDYITCRYEVRTRGSVVHKENEADIARKDEEDWIRAVENAVAPYKGSIKKVSIDSEMSDIRGVADVSTKITMNR